jgi:hypothetical protein
MEAETCKGSGAGSKNYKVVKIDRQTLELLETAKKKNCGCGKLFTEEEDAIILNYYIITAKDRLARILHRKIESIAKRHEELIKNKIGYKIAKQ